MSRPFDADQLTVERWRPFAPIIASLRLGAARLPIGTVLRWGLFCQFSAAVVVCRAAIAGDAGTLDLHRLSLVVTALGAAAVGSLVYLCIGTPIAVWDAERTQQLHDARHHCMQALETMRDGLCLFDRTQRLVIATGRFTSLYGLSEDAAAPGMHFKALVALIYAGRAAPRLREPEFLGWYAALAAHGNPFACVVDLADGRTIAVSHQPLADGGWLATHADATPADQGQTPVATRPAADEDIFTSAANRLQLRAALARGQQSGDGTGVLCLHIGRAGSATDAPRPPETDGLLHAAASRLLGALRTSDTVVRLGDSRVAILCTAMTDTADLVALADRLLARLRPPYELAGQQVVIACCAGIALGTPDDPDDLLRHATAALHRAQTNGHGSWCIYDPALDADDRPARAQHSDLRRALANEEFALFYQPMVDLRSGLVTGFEALLRWAEPQRGLLLPAAFMELAEESGLIVPLGAWVLRRATVEAARWPTHVRVGVNLSPGQFGPHLTQTVCAALQSSGLAPERLELDITEATLWEPTGDAIATLLELRALGVRVALDDFGGGHSSLSSLTRFPFDKIKIDPSFARSAGDLLPATAVVRRISKLAHDAGIGIAAERVETAEQLQWLRNEGFDEVQGHLFSPPRPAEALDRLWDVCDVTLSPDAGHPVDGTALPM